jgi:putative membrane protein
MIEKFKDHAANERTYLAWIRTAIAVMAFGFIVEKFGIFLSYISHNKVVGLQSHSSIFIEYIGLGLMLIAIIIIVGSSIRFFRYKNDIGSDIELKYESKWLSTALATSIFFIALLLFTYMIIQIIY